jgi:alpha-tubulin suppressor-like RCC1 family protein
VQRAAPVKPADPPGAWIAVSSNADILCGLRRGGFVECFDPTFAGTVPQPPAGHYIDVSIGLALGCAMQRELTVTCWHINRHTRGPQAREIPVPFDGLIAVRAGSTHACALRMGGQIACWDTDGTILQAPSGSGYRSIASGAGFSCAIAADGSVSCWSYVVDRELPDPPTGAFLQIAASGGSSRACGIRIDGTLDCWGHDYPGDKVEPPDGAFTQVSVGATGTCGLRSDGAVLCWNRNGTHLVGAPGGQFQDLAVRMSGGLGAFVIFEDGFLGILPHVEGDNEWMLPPPGSYRQIAAGETLSCGIRASGEVSCWGVSPTEVSDLRLPSGPFQQISTTDFHACGIRPDGSLDCWGYENAALSPPTVGRYSHVAVGQTFACALDAVGAVRCWGRLVPEGAPTSGRFIALDVQGFDRPWVACAIADTGRLACWGDDTDGQATPLLTPPEGQFVDVSLGANFGCAIRRDGSLQCWGAEHGATQLSDPLPGRFTAISSGVGHYCGVRDDGTVRCRLLYEGLGTGEDDPPYGSFLEVTSGDYFSCGLRTLGWVSCWGRSQ